MMRGKQERENEECYIQYSFMFCYMPVGVHKVWRLYEIIIEI